MKIRVAFVIGEYPAEERQRREQVALSYATPGIEIGIISTPASPYIRGMSPADIQMAAPSFIEAFREAERQGYDAVVPLGMAIYDKESMELLIKRVGVDNVLFATEMFGAVNAIDPKTGRNFEDLVPIFESIDWLSEEDRLKITEGNARKLFSRMAAQAKL